MKVVELIINESELANGIDAISLVEHPAIEENFIALNSQQDYVALKSIDDDKHLLVGACLIPEKPIYRLDENGDEFYVYFSKETIRRASEIFFKTGKQNRTTLEHEMMVNGLCVVESWIVEDQEKDKTAHYGLSYPVGTWVVSMKVENEVVWDEWVKTGRVKGFSIEGFFTDRLATKKANNSKPDKMNRTKIISKILALLSDEKAEPKQENFEQATLADGSTITAEKFEPGTPVYIVTDDGQLPLPVGEYPLEDGRTVVVAEEGIIAEVKPKEETTEPPAEPAEMSSDEEKEYARMKPLFERFLREQQNEQIDALIADLNAAKQELSAVRQELDSLKENSIQRQEFRAKKITVAPVEDESDLPRFRTPKLQGSTILSRVMENLAKQ